MAVEIKVIPKDRKSLRKFVQFGIDLYKGNDCYVPPLVSDDVATLSPEKNPAFDFCEAEYFMAFRDGKPVGRIAAIIHRISNEEHGKKEMRFGFVDFIDDEEVSRALFDAAAGWGKSKGMESMIGPLGFSDMDYEGMLVEGFDELSTMATIYNYPYYPRHMERMGFEKKADWVEFSMKVPDAIPDKHVRIAEIVKQKYGLKVVKYNDRKKAVAEIGRPLFELINESYKELFEFTQLTNRQIDHYVDIYIRLLRLDLLTVIKDADDNLVGVGVALPSLSRALQKSRGKMLPFGWWHLMRAMYFNVTDTVDLLLVAVKPEYQSKGVNALLFTDLIPYFQKYKFKYAESNPELELNQKVQAQWQYFETRQHKRRRAYGKRI
ncbi:MAG: N-acetyltransferase [Bacteroidetes bacterium]|uniref:N-acetyltransferase n=1 Tax=Candidatus Limisoma faecipullorum TaxID=2840854 RepID=A0A9D9IPB0_9BACT|nr:N-acetyltransferase [Candidatus Limisoma faecipullorum]